MNFAIRGIDADLGPHQADSFHNDLHKDLKADTILANPPFKMSDWGGERLKEDVRWKYDVPPTNNANYAWIQHFIYHLSPNGTAGFVMANGSMFTSTTAEMAIRKGIIEDDLVDCIIALPGQLFYTTQIPVCLWFLTRNKKADLKRGFRDRGGETLFIDARRMGKLVDRVHRELTPEDIDLPLYGDDLSLDDLAKLRARIEETTIPHQVDRVLVKETDNPKLLAHIREHGVEWFRREGKSRSGND